MRTNLILALLTSAVLAFSANVANAQAWQELQTSTDEAALIAAMEKPGDSPEDIHDKNVAAKRLSIYGTLKAIPALVASLSNEKLNFNARFALEAMPFDEVDAALAAATKELEGACLVGVIDTIGVRAKAESVAVLKAISLDDDAVQKAVYAACGMIGTDEAIDFLVSEANTKDFAAMNYYAVKGLGDALLDVAQDREKSGDVAKALELYALVSSKDFPKYEKDAGLYRTLLAQGEASAAQVVELVKGDDASAFDLAIKTIREYKGEVSAKVVEALLGAFDSLSEERQILVARAFGDLTQDAARKLAFAKLVDLAKAESVDMRVAATKALKKYAGELENVALTRVGGMESNDELVEAKVALGVALQKAKPELFEKISASELLDDLDETDAVIAIKIIENARVKSAGQMLVKIATEREGALRDAALSALSEIVELNDLNLLVDALNGETDDAKVDWLLRAACTRLPREECAAAVAEIFKKETLEQQLKTLPLLKQIGGQTALNAVADACTGQTLDKATQILGEWNTPEDGPRLAEISLAIAQQAKDNKYHSRGIRGYVRVARQFKLPIATKIEMCKTAFATARRTEDKALIFEVFKRNINAENVAAALEYAQYPEFKDAACEAAVFVAEKIRVSQPAWNWNEASGDAAKDAAAKTLVDGMKKVVETTNNADLKDRAQKLL